MALTYERLLADYSYSSERPFKRKSDGVCNFHVRLSLPLLPFPPFLDRRLGATPVTRTRPHRTRPHARAFRTESRACASYALVSSRLISSHLISSRLISSHLVSSRPVSSRPVSFCSIRVGGRRGCERAHAVRVFLRASSWSRLSLFEEANGYKSPLVSRLVSLFTNSLRCARNDLVYLEHSNNR